MFSATQIKVTVTVDATSGKISVTNAAGTATSTATFKTLPRVDSFSPDHGVRIAREPRSRSPARPSPA